MKEHDAHHRSLIRRLGWKTLLIGLCFFFFFLPLSLQLRPRRLALPQRNNDRRPPSVRTGGAQTVLQGLRRSGRGVVHLIDRGLVRRRSLARTLPHVPRFQLRLHPRSGKDFRPPGNAVPPRKHYEVTTLRHSDKFISYFSSSFFFSSSYNRL